MSGSSPPAPALSAAERFLFCACSLAPPAVRAERLQALAREGLDGERLVVCAQKNRVVPLLFRAVRSLAGAGLDASSQELLATHARRHQTEALVHLQECLRLLAAFAEQGVRAVPYKGPILAATLYDDLADRQYYDLDVLVAAEDVARARAVVSALGYEALDRLEGGAEHQHLAEDCELHFRHRVRGLVLELHWEALPRRHRDGFALDDVWERFVPLVLASRPVRGFGPEDLLLVLCIHGGEKHRWSRLQMLCDVARLLARHPALDWELLLARADEIGRRETVLLGVLCAWLLLEAPLPERLARLVALDDGLLAQAAATVGRIVRTDSGLVRFRAWSGYAQELVRRAAAGGVARRAAPGLSRYLAVVLRPEWTDRQALALPRALSLLYWLYRPWRLVRRHGTRLWQRF